MVSPPCLLPRRALSPCWAGWEARLPFPALRLRAASARRRSLAVCSLRLAYYTAHALPASLVVRSGCGTLSLLLYYPFHRVCFFYTTVGLVLCPHAGFCYALSSELSCARTVAAFRCRWLFGGESTLAEHRACHRRARHGGPKRLATRLVRRLLLQGKVFAERARGIQGCSRAHRKLSVQL